MTIMPTVRPRTTLYLWEFLLQLLDGKESCPAISWLNRDKGEFVLKDQGEIAKLWGKVKGRPRMDKIKLGRAMRYYYKKKLLAKVPRRKAVYRFVKFDVLMQKGRERDATHDDLPELDLNDNNVQDLIGDETPQGGPFSCLNIENHEDMPLESLLAQKNNQVSDGQEWQKVFSMENGSFQRRGTNNSDIRNNFTDCSSNYGSNVSCWYDNNYSCHIRKDFETTDHLNCFPTNTNIGDSTSSNEFNNFDSSGFLASLLVENMLNGNDTSESTNSRASWNFQEQSRGISIQNVFPESLQTLTSNPVKNQVMDPLMMPSYHSNETDMDSAVDAFKELERQILNKVLDI